MPAINATVDIPVTLVVCSAGAEGIGIITTKLILSIMVLPFISAVTRDVLETVPAMLKEATRPSAAPPGK